MIVAVLQISIVDAARGRAARLEESLGASKMNLARAVLSESDRVRGWGCSGVMAMMELLTMSQGHRER